MSDYRSPQHILNAFNRIEKELPTLVGKENWPDIDNQYQSQMQMLRQSSDVKQQRLLTRQLTQLITPYSAARERLNMEIELQALIADLLNPTLQTLSGQIGVNEEVVDSALAALEYTTQWSLDSVELPDITQVKERRLEIHEGGLDGGKTIKLKNIEFDFEKMPQLVGGSLLTIYGIFDKPHPLIIAAGVLATITAVVKAMTVTLSEQETSVFWGMIEACGNDCAPESEILNATNKARIDYGMELLDERQLLNSLKKLERLECIEQKQKDPITHWCIIEKYKIKN